MFSNSFDSFSILPKMFPGSLCLYPSAHGDVNIESSSLNFMIKVDNGDGLVAHSAQVPPQSTQLLISKLGIMIVPLSINLSTSHQILSCNNQSERSGFGHVLSPKWYHEAFELPTPTLPAALQPRSLNSLPLYPNNVILAKSI